MSTGAVNDTLRRPSAIALVASLCLFALGASTGGLLVRYQDALYPLLTKVYLGAATTREAV